MLTLPLKHISTLLHFVTTVRWGQYLKLIAYIALVSILGICFIPNAGISNALLRVLIVMILLAYCFKEWLDTPANWRLAKFRYAQTRNICFAAKELFPAEFRGWACTFVRMQAACFFRLTPINSNSADGHTISLSYLRNGMYTSLLPILIVACFADIPLTQFALHLYPIEPHIVVVAHSLSIMVTLLTITSLIGDKRLLAEGQHVIEQNILKLRLGARANADIPFDLIESIEVIDKKEVVILNTQLHSMEVSPFDKANLVIRLKAAKEIKLVAKFEELGSRRTDVHSVKLYLDRPDILLSYWNKLDA